jgi:hypothetical protein
MSPAAVVGYESTMFLLEQGVRLTGTDAWSWDAPFVHTAQKYSDTKGKCTTLKVCLQQVFTSVAFRTKSVALQPVGLALLQFLMMH